MIARTLAAGAHGLHSLGTWHQPPGPPLGPVEDRVRGGRGCAMGGHEGGREGGAYEEGM